MNTLSPNPEKEETAEKIEKQCGHVLVVEDDPDISSLLKLHLKEEGYEVSIIGTGDDALEIASTYRGKAYDLVVLDLMLPGADGYQVCKAFRKTHGDNCGILMLTAKHLIEDKILGFDVGADDYLTKPFCIDEFEARVRAIIRRVKKIGETSQQLVQVPISFGELVIDNSTKRVKLAGTELKLSPTEYRLLEFLAVHQGEAFSREELLLQVWGYRASGYENTVNTTVNRLRLKLEKDQTNPYYIKTVRGYGYRFVASDEMEM